MCLCGIVPGEDLSQATAEAIVCAPPAGTARLQLHDGLELLATLLMLHGYCADLPAACMLGTQYPKLGKTFEQLRTSPQKGNTSVACHTAPAFCVQSCMSMTMRFSQASGCFLLQILAAC